MPQLFARVELRGTPSFEIYQNLHALMQSMNWYSTLTGPPVPPRLGQQTITAALPHATYQAIFNETPDTAAEATKLKTAIETRVWTQALILVIEANKWFQTAG